MTPLVPCRTCARRVALDAELCPGCGAAAPGEGGTERNAARTTLAKRAGLVAVGLVLAGALVAGLLALLGGGDNYDSPRALADALGCTGFDDSSTVPGADLFDDGPASCQFEGATVVVLTADDAASRDRIARPKRSDGVHSLTGGNWAVQSRSLTAIRAAQDKLGGELHED